MRFTLQTEQTEQTGRKPSKPLQTLQTEQTEQTGRKPNSAQTKQTTANQTTANLGNPSNPGKPEQTIPNRARPANWGKLVCNVRFLVWFNLHVHVFMCMPRARVCARPSYAPASPPGHYQLLLTAGRRATPAHVHKRARNEHACVHVRAMRFVVALCCSLTHRHSIGTALGQAPDRMALRGACIQKVGTGFCFFPRWEARTLLFFLGGRPL